MKSKGKGKIRNFLVEQQGGICYWCNYPIRKASIEHVIPKSKGGTSNGANIVAACEQCNIEKSGRSPVEYIRMKVAKFERFLKSEGFKRHRKVK